MNRRTFIAQAGTALASAVTARIASSQPQTAADVKLEIAPLAMEIAPGKIIRTVAYNGQVPGPLIRWPAGKPIVIDVSNRSPTAENVHWHGLWIPSEMDGAMEEGSPMIAAGAQFRYAFTPEPAGFRWYHTHTFAGQDLKRSGYSGQFGPLYIEPKTEPGAYDQEFFLTLHGWNAYMGSGGDNSMEAAYQYGTVNGRMLGFHDPFKVREGQRVLLRILNASATMIHWLALAGHEMLVVAMDGNPVPRPASVRALRLGPAERADVLVTMNHPGIWILGETREPLRKSGMGIVVEYENQSGDPKWVQPPETLWDYLPFAVSSGVKQQPDETIPLVFDSKFRGAGNFAEWTINGKSYPHTDPIQVREGQRYRLRMTNKSTDDHPLHLHRHSFEVASIAGQQLSGLNKDLLVIPANATTEIDFTASNPGPTLFHCHSQSHMDFGFMMLLRYI